MKASEAAVKAAKLPVVPCGSSVCCERQEKPAMLTSKIALTAASGTSGLDFSSRESPAQHNIFSAR